MAIVLAIGDTHCPGMRRGYVEFLCRIRDRWKPTRIVHIGDLVDWNSIKFHEKDPGTTHPEEEYRRAKRQVAKLAAEFPKADWMVGNHDVLPARVATSCGLPLEVLRNYNDLWDIQWKVHERFAKLFIDGVCYSHGDSGTQGQDAALSQAKQNFCSTVIGHTHTQAGVRYWANKRSRIFGLSTGCGIDAAALQFAYSKPYPSKPVLGCGVVVNGDRAVFEPWLLPSKA